MEDKKKATSEDLQLLIDFHSNPMVLSDINGIILAINNQLAHILGKNKKDLIGKSGFDYIGKKVIKTRKNIIINVLKTKKSISFEDFDNNRWWITEVKPILNKNEDVIKLAIYVKEITDEKDSKNLVENLSEQSLMGIAIIQDNKFKYVNNALVEMGGFKKEDFYQGGISFFKKITHPSDLQFVLDQLNKKLFGNRNAIPRYTFRIFDNDKKLRWIEIYSKTIVYQGKFADFITVVDITEQKKVSLDLEEVEKKWRSLVDNLPITDRISIIDKSHRILYLNRTYPGRNINQFIGEKIDKFLDPESLNILKHHLNIVFKEGISQKYDTNIIAPDGSNRYFNTIAAPIKKEGKVVSVITISIDNTKLKETEFKAKTNFNYMKNILDNASEIIFTISPDKKISLWNRSAEKIIGYKTKKVVKKSIKNLNLFENIEDIEKFIENIYKDKKPILKEIVFNTIYGYKIVLGTSITKIRDESGNITDILFVCWDITKEKLTFKNLRSSYSYIITDEKLDRAIKLLNDYIDKGKKVIIFSRNIDYFLKNIKNKDKLSIFNFSSIKEENINNISTTNELKNSIKDCLDKNKNVIILIDRIDYLISIYSFETVIQTLYTINDFVRKKQSILLIRINDDLLDLNQRISLEQEFTKLPTHLIEDIKIDENLYSILKYIYKQNENNLAIKYQQIGTYFNISKVTVKNRIESLIEKELIYYKIQGRSKILYVSEKGKKYLK
jgi:PAS domain S-box-containing protein